jgi:TonB family protein
MHEDAMKRAQEDFARLIVAEPEMPERVMVSQPLQPTPDELSQESERSSTDADAAAQSGRPTTTGAQGGTAGDRASSAQPSDDIGSVGVLALLSTTGPSDREDRVADILGDEAPSTQDFDQILTNVDRLSREGKTGRIKDARTGTDKQTRGTRATTEENIDEMLTGLGTAQSTSVERSSDLIALEISPLTREGVAEGEDGTASAGARDPEKVSAVVNAHKAALQYCYQRELKRSPNLRGKIVVRFTIDPKGTVKAVKILSSTIDSEHVERCVLSRIRRWDDFGPIDPARGDATFRQVYSFGY